MNTRPEQPGTNGYEKAPPTIGGASAEQRRSGRTTAFLPDPPIRSFAAVGYASHRFLLGGTPASRYVSALLLLLSLLWMTGLLPGRWLGTAFIALLFVAHIAVGVSLKRRDYVKFREGERSATTVEALDATQSLPVYVTGGLSVEGRQARFTFLPGFYNTFATREHALLCQARQRDLVRMLHWPLDEVGMWYAFFEPQDVKGITWGALSFLPDPMPALAIAYEVLESSQSGLRRKKTEVRTESTIYLATDDEAILRRIAADLLYDQARDDIAEPDVNPSRIRG